VASASEADREKTVNEDRLMDVNEVAEFLGLAVGTVYHLVSQKRLPCLRLSARCLRFRKSDLTALLDELAKESACTFGERK
jgi:excisionase family DNA binding protein